MKIVGTTIYLSASDLSTHMYCGHATFLNIQEAKKLIKANYRDDPMLISLQEKGEQFEKDYIEELKRSGKWVVEIGRENSEQARAETIAAMQQGADIIYQARLESGIWNGWADFLIKVENQSALGNWSYEVLDTKLSKETKTGAILQISLYSEIIEKIQGVKPEYMHIKNPNGEHRYRVDDFAAYFRYMKQKLLDSIKNEEETYPDPVIHCEVCKWWQVCNKRRREDDHLSFIAGMGTLQIREVKKWHITTLESMAGLTVPLLKKPERGSAETFEKLAHQARLQLEWRRINQPVFEILPLQENIGFYQLPAPSEHDIFFDFEGDPYAGSTGIEYLFGWYYRNSYYDLWANNEAEEKDALEKFMDIVMKIREQDPQMHIYHFGAYEQTALKRLVGKYATREDDLDQLLRGHVFVNLHTITRHAVIAGVERYSLKDLEKVHGYQREVDLKIVSPHKLLYEGLLESGNLDAAAKETVQIVRDYNRDDCISAQYLRDWLEKLRSELVEKGNNIPRPKIEDGAPSENITAHQERIQPLFNALTKDIPFDKESRTDEQQARWLLANMLDWYRREKKSVWWEYFRLLELPDEDLLEEKDAISKLVYTGRSDVIARSVIDYYEFPEQEFEIEAGDTVKFRGEPIGTIFLVSRSDRLIGLKKGIKQKDNHPTHVVKFTSINDKEKEEAVIRIAEWVAQNGIRGEGRYKAGRDLLLRAMPFFNRSEEYFEDPLKEAIDRAIQLKNGILPIQGPPGTGKSYTASHMIIALIKSGKKIGITALSHKVIIGLLEKVVATAEHENFIVRIVQKVPEKSEANHPNWKEVTDNGQVVAGLQSGCNIAAGTSFMWARQEFFESVDYMFVDEAGQLSLIDTLALSHSGKNLVLLGDPQQLKQPQKGSHPEGTEVSALEHILQQQKTISHEQGVFLNKTWRMHPAISEYISGLFYDNRLETVAATSNQRLEGSTMYDEPGIYFHAVTHSGNQSSSVEEVDKVHAIVNDLLSGSVHFINSRREKHQLSGPDIKIISPYNAQVNALKPAMPLIQTGTVDKFQGQEAPVIIFSMATSSAEDAPRGMEFLYSLNRLNVAVSRAQAVFILVASPALFEPVCRSPFQMKLANALCRLKEVCVE
jgi:predicted RecB family nuclease